MDADVRGKGWCAAALAALLVAGSVWAQPAPYAVDFGQPLGKIKALNGTNIGPLYKGRNIKTALQDFAEICAGGQARGCRRKGQCPRVAPRRFRTGA